MRIADDVIPEGYLRDLLTVVDKRMLWKFLENTSYRDISNPNIWDKMISALIIDNGQKFDESYDFFYPITYLIERAFDLKISHIYRMKVNRTFTVPEDVNLMDWHVDISSDRFKSVVLYMDESDGDTFISDSTFLPSEGVNVPTEEMVNGIEQVPYRKNRMVLFNSHQIHCGAFPKHHKCRTILNVVFV